jgi:NADH:ubiquinone oxidoreductase subunit E
MKTDIIKASVEKYGNDRENLMLILRDLETQSGKNVLEPAVLTEVAEQMNLPKSAIAGFLGFYTMFKTEPRAKYLIRVCKSGPCHVMGSSNIFHVV